jgi:hypothetical protein
MFKEDVSAELMLMRVPHGHKLKSVVAENGKGERMITPPVITDHGILYLVQAARDAGWRPCYVVTARPK